MYIESEEIRSMSDKEMQGIYTGVVDEIQRRLDGKPLDAGAKAAIAWVVGKEAPLQEGLPKEDNARQVDTLFGTHPADAAAATAWKIRERIRQLAEPEVMKREQAGENLTLYKMLQKADHRQASETYANGKVPSLGAVPKEWVPAPLQQSVQAEMLE